MVRLYFALSLPLSLSLYRLSKYLACARVIISNAAAVRRGSFSADPGGERIRNKSEHKRNGTPERKKTVFTFHNIYYANKTGADSPRGMGPFSLSLGW